MSARQRSDETLGLDAMIANDDAALHLAPAKRDRPCVDQRVLRDSGWIAFQHASETLRISTAP